MKNKKLLIAGASVASLAALGLGAFAFFTDTVELNKDTKVGTVDVEATAEIKHTQLKREVVLRYPYLWEDFYLPIYPNWISDPNLQVPSAILEVEREDLTQEVLLDMFETAQDNLNPGDNMFQNNSSAYPGTDHEIIVNVTNEGSKSVTTRILFEITGTDASGSALSANDLRAIKLYFDEMNSVSGLTSIHAPSLANEELFTNRILLPEVEENEQDENKLIYGFDASLLEDVIDRSQTNYGSIMLNELSDAAFTGMVFSGSEEHANRETEIGIKKYYVETEDSAIWSLETEDITAPTSGSFKFDLGLDSGVYLNENYEYVANNDILESLAKLEGATINIKVIVQGMQYPLTQVLNNQSQYFLTPLIGWKVHPCNHNTDIVQ
jgi:hypothetical protein